MKTLFALLLTIGSACGLTFFSDINSPELLPEGLTIAAKPRESDDGKVHFNFTFHPADLPPDYVGDRVIGSARLEIGEGGAKSLECLVEMNRDEKTGIYSGWLIIDRALCGEAVLSFSRTLFEKDGMQTLGGGEIYRVHLGGFLPEEKTTSDSAK